MKSKPNKLITLLNMLLLCLVMNTAFAAGAHADSGIIRITIGANNPDSRTVESPLDTVSVFQINIAETSNG